MDAKSPTATRDARPINFEVTGSITVKVTTIDEDDELHESTFAIHRKYLEQSPFFADRLKRLGLIFNVISLTGHTHTANLPYYLHFLATNRLADCQALELAKLYVYGETMRDKRFKNAVIAAMLAELEATSPKTPFFGVRVIYEGTGEGSPARSMLVDYFQIHGEADWLKDIRYPTGFVRDVAVKVMGAKGETGKNKLKAEDYFEPEPAKPKEQEKKPKTRAELEADLPRGFYDGRCGDCATPVEDERGCNHCDFANFDLDDDL